MSAPFSQDTANQIAQTKGFQGLLDDTAANNTAFQTAGDQIQSVARGQMATAFAGHHAEIVSAAQNNRTTLEGLTTGLNHGIQSVQAQEETGASLFQGMV